MLSISPTVRAKLARPDHNVTEVEIEQAFANRDGRNCKDGRAWHQTNPPTLWFVAETDRGRWLKVMFIIEANGDIRIKSAYTADAEIIRIFNKYGT